MGARFGFTNIDKKYDRGISDMDVVNRERTTADPFAPGAAGDPDKFDTLMYPLDLNPENFFPEAICFQVKKRIGLTMEELGDAVGESLSELVDALNPMTESKRAMAFSKEVQAKIAQHKEAGSNPVGIEEFAEQQIKQKYIDAGIPLPAENWLDNVSDGQLIEPFSKGYGALQGKLAEQKRMTLRGTTANTLGNIYMNMPDNIQFSDAANWDPTSLGWVGAIKNSVSESVAGGLAGSVGNLSGAALGGSLGYLMKLMKIPHAGGMLGGLLGAVSQGTTIQHGLESAMSMKQNPYMEMMFQGVGFRKFSFNFVMRPRNEDEIKQTVGIIRAFRLYSRPSWSEGILGHGFMKYPMEFHISFLTLEDGTARVTEPNKMATNSDKVYNINQNIPQIKPCVCTNVETNYTPQSIWAAYKGGQPIAVTLGLSFNETELVMADDVERGY